MMRRTRLLVLSCFVGGAVGWSAAVPSAPLPSAGEIEVNTFSIVAYDPDAKEWGCAVASKYLSVGRAVPWAKAGAGVVATQAQVNLSHGPNGVELLAQGKSAAETLKALQESDQKDIQKRQLGIVDAKGDAVTFTGTGCTKWAGGKTGKYYACQGNILAGEAVVNDMAKAFEETKGPLAWRLIAALEAGDKAGGDTRGKQSAAVLVVREGKGTNTVSDRYRYLDYRVDDHPEPIPELARILAKHPGMKRPK
jgi:uncharacterized Ntn-hydrolase superfamily protein